MSGPANPNPRQLAAGGFEELEKQFGAKGWDFFRDQFGPALVGENFDPGEDFKKNLAAFARTDLGRRIVEWLLDMTCRAPYPATSQDMQDLAFAAAKHQARAAVGEVIVKAIADGNAILNR